MLMKMEEYAQQYFEIENCRINFNQSKNIAVLVLINRKNKTLKPLLHIQE
jgi:hypothetical protein